MQMTIFNFSSWSKDKDIISIEVAFVN